LNFPFVDVLQTVFQLAWDKHGSQPNDQMTTFNALSLLLEIRDVFTALLTLFVRVSLRVQS